MNTFHNFKTTLLNTAITVASAALILTGCGGGGGSSSKPPVSSAISSSVASSVSSSDPASSSSSSESSVSSQASESSSNSSVSSAPQVRTTYKITIDVPESLLNTQASSKPQNASVPQAEKAVGSDVLTASNFAVACVDLSGTILEVIPLEENDVVPNDDGSWSITVRLEPSVNCLVIANLYEPLDLKEGDSINSPGNLYAPNSAESITVSPASTVAFDNFVEELGGSGTFEDADINPRDPEQISAVDNVMTNIAALLAEQDFSASTLAEILEKIAAIIAPVIAQEVNNVKNPVTSTAAELIRDGGGMYNISSRWGGIIYTALVGDTASYAYFDNGEFVSRATNRTNRDYVLSSNGWAEAKGIDVVSSYNGDGSVTYKDIDADGFKTIINVTQGFNLAGSNIANLLFANDNTTHISEVVDPDAVFSEGAVGYRVSITYPQLYAIYIHTGEANGTCWGWEGQSPEEANGNCNMQELRRDNNIFERPIVDYETLFSPDVDINAMGSRSISLGEVGSNLLVAQLIKNSEKTVKFYERTWDWGGSYAKLIGTGTWTETTLPNLSENNKAVRFEYPKSVLAVANIWSQQNYQAYTVQDGYVRHLAIHPPSAQPSGTLVFNKAAKDDIMNALKK